MNITVKDFIIEKFLNIATLPIRTKQQERILREYGFVPQVSKNENQN